jgi:hypothetical protein
MSNHEVIAIDSEFLCLLNPDGIHTSNDAVESEAPAWEPEELPLHEPAQRQPPPARREEPTDSDAPGRVVVIELA